MRVLTPQLTPELKDHVEADAVGRADAFVVSSYRELMEHVARLAYLNMDHLLFFRGQDRDYRNKAGSSTLYPQIYRGERVGRQELQLRFDLLDGASSRLCVALEDAGLPEHRDVRRRRYIQWSILQHYEVAPTPLLDLTHSLRVACSFAFGRSDEPSGDPMVFVLGMPYITNRISLNSEQDIVTVRLLSICPPMALRPYFQDGYLAGTDEVTTEFDSKSELDFNNRLIAKFALRPDGDFWGHGFSPVPEEYLYPGNDRMQEICSNLADDLGTAVSPGGLGRFIQAWSSLENVVMSMARLHQPKVYSFVDALRVLERRAELSAPLASELDELRRLRNRAVHHPSKLASSELVHLIRRTEELERELKMIW